MIGWRFSQCRAVFLGLTGLPGRVFHEQGGDVLVHPHLVLGDAGVGASVFVAHAADVQLTAIG